MYIYILYYKNNLSRKEITELNNYLFGKVISKGNKKYYYPGVFDNTKCFKLSNGAYILKSKSENITTLFKVDDRFNLVQGSLNINEDAFKTIREIKQKKYEGQYIKNL